MQKKLTAHGNSLALVIEKPVLQLLNITAETALNISTDGKSITVSPVTLVAGHRGRADRSVGRKVKKP
jgi:antitoxin component of MazEF toxin-antitoxin module